MVSANLNHNISKFWRDDERSEGTALVWGKACERTRVQRLSFSDGAPRRASPSERQLPRAIRIVVTVKSATGRLLWREETALSLGLFRRLRQKSHPDLTRGV